MKKDTLAIDQGQVFTKDVGENHITTPHLQLL